MKNPVEPTPKSIAAGKNVYDKYCADCHGATGNGVSEKSSTLAAAGEAKPSDLTDNKWDHGSTDGEIFVNSAHHRAFRLGHNRVERVIRNGAAAGDCR